MRPQTLEELWRWAYHEGQGATLEAPDRLHAKHPYPETDEDLPRTFAAIRRPTVQRLRTGAIVGRPFTRAFIRYLEGGRAMTPVRRALLDMVPNRPKARTLEHRIAWAVVEGGHSDPEIVRAIEGCSWETFRRAAVLGLAHLYDKTQREISDEPKRTLTVEAQSGIVPIGAPRTQGARNVGSHRRRRSDRERAANG